MRLYLGILCVLFLVGCGGSDDGGTAPSGPTNRAPQVFIDAQTSLLALVDGDTVTLDAIGTDLDGDTLSYRWRVVSGGSSGSLSATTGEQVVWTASAVPGVATIEVIANDGEVDSIRPDTQALITGTHIDDGTLSEDTTFDLANSPYVVMSDIRVGAGLTLTLEAGVELYFRPTVSFPGPVIGRRSFVVDGVLQIDGSPKGAGNVVLRGGRDPESIDEKKQWNGILFQGLEDNSISGLTIRDATDGLSNSGEGELTFSNSTVQDCINGIVLVDPYEGIGQGIVSVTTLEGVTVSANLANGIMLNSSVMSLTGSTVTSNGLTGVLVAAATDYTYAETASCLIANNEAANLSYDNNLMAFDYFISNCNIIPHPDDNVGLKLGSCPFGGAFDITGNYWGVNADVDVQPIKDRITRPAGCSDLIDSWVPNVDWLNAPIQFN